MIRLIVTSLRPTLVKSAGEVARSMLARERAEKESLREIAMMAYWALPFETLISMMEMGIGVGRARRAFLSSSDCWVGSVRKWKENLKKRVGE